MLDIQASIIGKTFLVIGVFYTSMLLAPFLLRKIRKIIPRNNRKKKDKETDTESEVYLRETKNIVKESAISTLVFFAVISITFLIIFTGIFLYSNIFRNDVNGFTEAFNVTKAIINQQFWMDGIMIFAYTPVILSALIVFVVITIYSLSMDDFRNNIAFVNVDNDFVKKKKTNKQNISLDDEDELFNSKKNKNNKMNITQKDWFRKNYIILIFIASLFIYTIIFVPLWTVEKMAYIKSVLLILLILISSLATLHKWWVMFIAYFILITGYFLSKQ
jgi:hypothetical protein